MVETAVILPSPLLPGVAYTPLRDALRGAGTSAVTLGSGPAAGWLVEDLVDRWSEDCRGADLIVAHSNAGYLAPSVRDRAGARARLVFVDAALPPQAGSAPLAPASLRATLEDLADERGRLPPWTRWWPEDALRAVVPEAMLDAIDRECPRLPVRYFDQRVQAPPGWAERANAYLAFGETYAAERRFAREHRWPTGTIAAGHLHFLHDPGRVADRILALAGELP